MPTEEWKNQYLVLVFFIIYGETTQEDRVL